MIENIRNHQIIFTEAIRVCYVGCNLTTYPQEYCGYLNTHAILNLNYNYVGVTRKL